MGGIRWFISSGRLSRQAIQASMRRGQRRFHERINLLFELQGTISIDELGPAAIEACASDMFSLDIGRCVREEGRKNRRVFRLALGLKFELEFGPSGLVIIRILQRMQYQKLAAVSLCLEQPFIMLNELDWRFI